MLYESTRNNKIKITSAEAITQGLSKDGGLFVPEELPFLELGDIECLAEKSYVERAIEILSIFLTDFSDEQLVSCVSKAYTAEKFETDAIIDISHLYEGRYMLELWHGPTCAFKDMALQLLPHLLITSAELLQNKKEVIILVATSGDTGKAALEGFKDIDKTRVIVFYPQAGVSPMQRRQMISQEGKNVHVCAIDGNFDDAQAAVKSIFNDSELAALLDENGKVFSSANSINWGRLLPQIVYYISAYTDLVTNEEIKLGDAVNVCVPTGNFGNILAAYYAKKMGVPIDKLICASNENKVLTDFINTGIYDKNREFKTTISPSMDILISSNLERLLYALADNNDTVIAELYNSLAKTGKFEVSPDIKAKLKALLYGGYCDDTQTQETIKSVFNRYSYLCDPHTAVAVKVYEDYRKKTGDNKKVIIASTANPYKFTSSVLSSIKAPLFEDEYSQIEELFDLSGLEIPKQLIDLKNSKVRFDKVIKKSEIKSEVMQTLGIG